MVKARYLWACGVYLAIFLGCILFRIESWPFSDYRVFHAAHSLEQVEVYRLAVDGGLNRVWLYEGEEAYKNKSINDKAFGFLGKDRDKSLLYMSRHLEAAHKYKLMNYERLVLMKLTLILKDGRVTGVKSEPGLWLWLR